jgi:uncharacterized protein YukE
MLPRSASVIERIAAMSDIQLNYGLMEQVAQNLTKQAGLIQQYVEDLQQSLQQLFQTWGMTGSPAATAMQQDENQLRNTINQIVELINNWANTVTQARELQAGIDKSNAAMFGNYA